MNFYDALNAHLVWKLRLREYIAGNTAEYLEPHQVGCHDGCDLGQWIDASFHAMKHLPEYRKVREQHADFHRCAAEVVAAVNRGDTDSANLVLVGEYAHLSALVIKSITKLNKALADAQRLSDAAVA